MDHAITTELQFFLISILWGGLVLLAYDVLRIFRRLIKHNSLFLAIQDILFWIAASVFIFTMIYNENNGIIRGFCVMGMTIGMVLYHYTISGFIVDAITTLIRTLLRPFAIAAGVVKKILCLLGRKIKQILKLFIEQLKKLKKSYKISLDKRKHTKAAKKQKKEESRKAASEKKPGNRNKVQQKKPTKQQEKPTKQQKKPAKQQKINSYK